MLFSEILVCLRGGGDLATGVAYRLHHAGFPVVVLELLQPLVIRRAVALAQAVYDTEVQVSPACGAPGRGSGPGSHRPGAGSGRPRLQHHPRDETGRPG